MTLTLSAAPDDRAEVTLAYTAPASNPVRDAAGNPAPGFSDRTVIRGPAVENVDFGPMPAAAAELARRYGYTEAQLSSNVLGLRRYKLHEMTAHGEGAVLTFAVTFKNPVNVTGKPMLKLDLWGETKACHAETGICHREHPDAHLHLDGGNRRQRLRRDRGEGAASPRRDIHPRHRQPHPRIRRPPVQERAVQRAQDLRRLPRDVDRGRPRSRSRRRRELRVQRQAEHRGKPRSREPLCAVGDHRQRVPRGPGARALRGGRERTGRQGGDVRPDGE